MKLRPYQSTGRDQILACIQRRAHVLYVLPTGGGKSVVIASVIATLAALGWRICLIAHRDELVQQLSGALSAAGVDHGVIAPGHELTGHNVHVASVATLDRRRNDPSIRAWLASLDLLVPDEAHHTPAGQWQRIIGAALNATRFGATATGYRLDGRGLGDTFGEAVRGPAIRWLVRMGYLAGLKVYAPPVPLVGMEAVGKSMGDYKRSDLAKVMNTPEVLRAAVAWYGRLMAGKKVLSFCVDLDHVAATDAAFEAAGWHSATVDGTMTQADRRAVVDAFRSGRTQQLASCELIGEGFDVPAVAGALMKRRTMSTGLYQQQNGRPMRPVYAAGFDSRAHDGEGTGDVLARLGAMARGPKPHGIVVDLVGNVTHHGMPDADRPWTLQGGVAGLERQVPPTSRCPRCYLVVEAGADRCPGCGAEYVARLSVTVNGVPLHLLPPVGGLPAATIATMDFPSLTRLDLPRADWERVAEIRQVAPKAKDRREWAARVAEQAGKTVRNSHLLAGGAA